MSFPLGAITDANVDYLMKREFLAPFRFIKAATTSTTGQVGPSTLTAGYNGTAAQFANIGGNEIGALRFASTAATATAIWRPTDVDNRHPVYLRYAWTSSSAVASVATFNSLFSLVAAGAVPATPSTSLTKDIVAEGKATAANSWNWTRWGAIAPLSTGQNAFQTFPATVDAVVFSVSVSSLTLAALATDFAYLYGVEVAYTPRLTFGDGSGREARYMNQPLAVGPQEAGPTVHIKQ